MLVDVPRTAPDVQLFRDERIKKLLTRILYIWAMRHPASSYVQGINDLAMPLIITFLTEKTSVGPESNDDIGDIEYDKVLDGRIMESVSDERLDEVSYRFLFAGGLLLVITLSQYNVFIPSCVWLPPYRNNPQQNTIIVVRHRSRQTAIGV